MIQTITNEINRCLENNCQLAALALSLTLPDTCGKAAFPHVESTQKHYIDWYNEYIGEYLHGVSISNQAGLADRPYLSGELVYQLRCSFLHSSDTDVDFNKIEEEQNKMTEFNLLLCDYDDSLSMRTSSLLSYGRDMAVNSRCYDVSIILLCRMISGEALKYYCSNKEKFTFLSFNIVDNTGNNNHNNDKQA